MSIKYIGLQNSADINYQFSDRCVAIIPAFLWSQTEEKKFKAAYPIKEETDRYIS